MGSDIADLLWGHRERRLVDWRLDYPQLTFQRGHWDLRDVCPLRVLYFRLDDQLVHRSRHRLTTFYWDYRYTGLAETRRHWINRFELGLLHAIPTRLTSRMSRAVTRISLPIGAIDAAVLESARIRRIELYTHPGRFNP